MPGDGGRRPLRGSSRIRRRLGALALLACALLALGFAAGASASTIAVANLNDSGPGSLREAIKDASPGDTITVPPGEITLASPLEVKENLTILGAGAGASVISGGGSSRVFTIAAEPTVTLQRLEITGGVENAEGGGIDATGNLTLREVLVTGNRAGGGFKNPGFGGGIESAHGSLTLIDSTVSDNTAGGGGEGGDGRGAGIYYEPTGNGLSFTLTLSGSTVSGNVAGGGSEANGRGAGINASSGELEDGTVTVSLEESVVAGNLAGVGGGGVGGGIEVGGPGFKEAGRKDTYSLSLANSAVTANVAGGEGLKSDGFGGGIALDATGEHDAQTLSVSNTTIAANTAGGNGFLADGFGGGIEVATGGTGSTSSASLSYATIAGNSAGGESFGGGLDVASVTVGSSIIAANPGGNCLGPITSSGHNIDDDGSCGFTGAGDKSGVGALLGPLGEHGGPGETLMPLAGSPALDAADPATCPATDQRGVSRPQGAGCDIGAVEVAPPAVATGAVASVGPESATVVAAVNPNFSETTYHVEFGTTTAYGAASASASAGSGGVAQAVAAALGGLQPQTAYHYRVLASNAAGTVVGGDAVLRTPAATAPPKPARPTLLAAKLTNTRFRVGAGSTAIVARRAPVGTAFKFKLTAAASLRIAITRSLAGLRRGRGCVAPTHKLRHAHAKRCTRTLTIGVLTRANLSAGAHTIAFSGRIGRRALSPRTYQASLSASNAGGRSSPVLLRFLVVR